MKNYIADLIKDSEYLLIFIKKAIGDNNGVESYLTQCEIKEMAKNLSPKILTTKIKKEIVWYYNMYVSKDTRNNIDIKILNSDIKRIRKDNDL